MFWSAVSLISLLNTRVLTFHDFLARRGMIQYQVNCWTAGLNKKLSYLGYAYYFCMLLLTGNVQLPKLNSKWHALFTSWYISYIQWPWYCTWNLPIVLLCIKVPVYTTVFRNKLSRYSRNANCYILTRWYIIWTDICIFSSILDTEIKHNLTTGRRCNISLSMCQFLNPADSLFSFYRW